MKSIDALMEYRNPGDVLLIKAGASLPFRPFFKAKGRYGTVDYWYGTCLGEFACTHNLNDHWEIYENVKDPNAVVVTITKEQLEEACRVNCLRVDSNVIWGYLINVSK